MSGKSFLFWRFLFISSSYSNKIIRYFGRNLIFLEWIRGLLQVKQFPSCSDKAEGTQRDIFPEFWMIWLEVTGNKTSNIMVFNFLTLHVLQWLLDWIFILFWILSFQRLKSDVIDPPSPILSLCSRCLNKAKSFMDFWIS